MQGGLAESRIRRRFPARQPDHHQQRLYGRLVSAIHRARCACRGQSDTITRSTQRLSGFRLSRWRIHINPSNRSLKYAPLFVGFCSSLFFIFEVTTGKRFTRRSTFGWSCAKSSLPCCCSLCRKNRIRFRISAGRRSDRAASGGQRALDFRESHTGIAGVCGFHAAVRPDLHVAAARGQRVAGGAIASFLAVAAAMYFTRSIDWYGSIAGPGAEP